ncbi:MAG: DUF3830 family protein [Gaiellaceae bacterium MAG52_C11]|nr:DUF3830 family protein [Candidatus Gaiellasilicea maunaloa]
MPKTLTFHIVELEAKAVADLLEDRAPRTCELIWERLPLEERLVHGMYSGPELFIVLDGFPGVGPENQVSRPLPGDVGYFHQDPGLYASSPHEVAELVYVYDRGAAIKGAEGHDSWVNLFATLRPEGAEAFLAASKRARREGPFTLRVEAGRP